MGNYTSKPTRLDKIQISLDELKVLIEQSNSQGIAKSINPLYVEKTLEKLTKAQEEQQKEIKELVVPTIDSSLKKCIDALEEQQKELEKKVTSLQEAHDKLVKEVQTLQTERTERLESKKGEKTEKTEKPDLKIRQPSAYTKPVAPNPANKIDTTN